MSPMIWVISVSLAEADGSAARVGRVKLSPIRASDPCARALVEERRAGRLIARKLARKVLIPVEELHRWASALLTDEIRWSWRLLPLSEVAARLNASGFSSLVVTPSRCVERHENVVEHVPPPGSCGAGTGGMVVPVDGADE